MKSSLIKIRLGDYISLLTDYHSGGSYQTMAENTKILYKPDYAVMIRSLNFERDDFDNDLIYCDKKSYDFMNYCHVQENDILMNKIANPGNVYLMPKVDYKTVCGMNLFLMRFKNISQKYIYYVMKNKEDYIKTKTHGSTTKTITKEDVRELRFYIHSNPAERDAVENVLSNIDEKIYINKKIQKKIFEYLNLIYLEEFSQKETNGTINDLIVEEKKSKIQVNETENVKGIYPFFTSGEDVNEWDEYLVDGVNLFLSTGGNASIKIYDGKAAYSTDTYVVQGKNDSTIYLYFFIKNVIDKINDWHFLGSGLKHLQKDSFSQIKIYIPNSDELTNFNSKAKELVTILSQKMDENRKLIELKKELLPLLMNGQIRLTK